MIGPNLSPLPVDKSVGKWGQTPRGAASARAASFIAPHPGKRARQTGMPWPAVSHIDWRPELAGVSPRGAQVVIRVGRDTPARNLFPLLAQLVAALGPYGAERLRA